MAWWYLAGCQLDEFLFGWDGLVRIAPEPDDHTPDVGIEEGHILLKGKTGDGPRCISADAWQSLEGHYITWECASVLRDDRLCRALQINRAPIVAEPLPGRDNGARGGIGQGMHVGELRQKGVIFGDDTLDLRLLQHQLGHQNAVGVTRMPPRQVAPMCGKPGQQR